MPIRVIAGSARGRRLKPVPGSSTRPVMDKVKEAVFSIIGPEIVDCTFLDLFSGTGSVGIEALSRGARQAVFVELEKAAIRTIWHNLKTTRLDDRALVLQRDVFSLLKQGADRSYDFIYIAPPQYKEFWLRALQTLDDNPGWLAEHTTVIIQIDPKEQQSLSLKNLEETDRRVYGKTMVWFFQLVADDKTTEG